MIDVNADRKVKKEQDEKMALELATQETAAGANVTKSKSKKRKTKKLGVRALDPQMQMTEPEKVDWDRVLKRDPRWSYQSFESFGAKKFPAADAALDISDFSPIPYTTAAVPQIMTSQPSPAGVSIYDRAAPRSW